MHKKINLLEKLQTFYRAWKQLENWPTAVNLRLRSNCPRLRLLSFRNGMLLACRGATQDWDVINGLALSGEYKPALDFLSECAGQTVVLDLGANIGVFSLLCARAHQNCQIHAYEPAPLNSRMAEINRLINFECTSRIHLHTEAVGGQTRRAQFCYDDTNPQASGLFHKSGTTYPVQIQSFEEVIKPYAIINLVKMDIEGAEYEIMEQTSKSAWQKISAIVVEVHDDPN
ncbi:MAG TPA: FkbM family methyltransferase, partial [Verrucomicrobiae bacterium]